MSMKVLVQLFIFLILSLAAVGADSKQEGISYSEAKRTLEREQRKEFKANKMEVLRERVFQKRDKINGANNTNFRSGLFFFLSLLGLATSFYLFLAAAFGGMGFLALLAAFFFFGSLGSAIYFLARLFRSPAYTGFSTLTTKERKKEIWYFFRSWLLSIVGFGFLLLLLNTLGRI